MRWYCATIILINFAFIQASPLQPAPDTISETIDLRNDPYRLERVVEPINYMIDLRIESNFFETKSFEGHTSILFKTVKENVTKIVLHSKHITHKNVVLTESGVLDPIKITFVDDKNEYDFITIKPNTALKLNQNYSLTFDGYTGILGDDMHGFYLSSYKNEKNEVEYIATTQFQTTHARRAFPCFDEPNFKATFKINLRHPPEYFAISNTPAIKNEHRYEYSGEVKSTAFETTPVMSTYLVAFVISKFTCWQNADKTFRVFVKEEANSTIEYAFTVGPKLLKQLDDYMGIPYLSTDIGKMDLVAIPDFSAGAMENWGLLTYRETALLWDELDSTNKNKQRVATVIAHEMTHMWFGDLVTLDWWSNTWLNEGFARYFQYIITSKVETKWELEKQFVVEQQQVIFGTDALASTLPLTSEVSKPNEISNKFSSVSYSKGASIIRMVSNFVGKNKLKTSLRTYLKDNAYKNTLPTDLWKAFKDVAPQLPPETTLEQVMKNWIEKPGYPVVSVTMENGLVTLKQERFLLNKSESTNTIWDVPISYTTSKEGQKDFANRMPKFWLLRSQDNIPIEKLNLSSNEWIILNIGETAYYRVNYHTSLWKNLEGALKKENFDGIDEMNRAQIVDDILNLARAHRVEYNIAFNVTSYLENEIGYYPWYSAFSAFSFLMRRIGDDQYFGRFIKERILQHGKKLFDNNNFTDIREDDQIYSHKQVLALEWACNLEKKECVDEANKLFDDYKNNKKIIHSNLRSIVYCSALRQSNDLSRWDFLWEKFTKGAMASEEATILSALGCTKNEDKLKEYLHKSINATSGIRKQDASSVFTSVYTGNSIGIKVAFEFLKENHKDIANYYGSMNALSNLITGLAERFTTEEQINQLQEFYEKNKDDLKDAFNAINNAIENSKANVAWTNVFKTQLENWVGKDSSTVITINLSLLLGTIILVIYNSMN